MSASQYVIQAFDAFYFYNKRNIDETAEKTKKSIQMLFVNVFLYIIVAIVIIILFIMSLPYYPKKWMIILVGVTLIVMAIVGLIYAKTLIVSDLEIMEKALSNAFKPYTTIEFADYLNNCHIDQEGQVFSCPPYT